MKAEDLIENRKIIYQHIKRRPGSHLRGISRDLGLSLSTVRHHISFLEKNELIAGKVEGNTRVFFCMEDASGLKRAVFPLLQQKRFRDIVAFLLIRPGATPMMISDGLQLNPSTLSKYLGILERRGMMEFTKKGREKHYTLVDENRIITFLIAYRESFLDRMVDNVLEIYFDR